MRSSAIAKIASILRISVMALLLASAGCCHRDELRPQLPETEPKSTLPCPAHPEAINKERAASSEAKPTSLRFFFTPATFEAKQMKVALRIYNDGEVPVLIRSIEIIEANVDYPSPEGTITRTMGGMHARADHASSRIAPSQPDVWHFSLPFPCAPFIQLTLQTVSVNEGNGSMNITTFVTGVDAYEGCPAGWEKFW